MLCHICHVYSQDLNSFMSGKTPKSVILASNCSICFGVIHYNMFISGCRHNKSLESKTLHESYGVICSRFPTYCGFNLCCCTFNGCYNQLRNHFRRTKPHLKKAVTCEVYRQSWIRNGRSKGLNKSSYPTSEEMYRRTDCTACISRVDEEGVEMTCAEESVDVACRDMDLLVGGSVVCNAYGDCCCQGNDCSKVLRNFYSGNQKMLGTPRTASKLNTAYAFSSNLLIIISSLFIIVVLEL
ncbi:unnamed protein product [Litomosoides sigmodontis]|uniref:Uncharacterized protein n=1 Tax=Litomosoides sigmodontis TaxID=42156 RepID=A0A3P6SKG3_LITSI|nr:unnamed protein product [Litomosoides sigmodontis]